MTSTQLRIPYRSSDHIEFAAQRLLCQYCRDTEPIIGPPVPIEELLERHLRLDLAFGDLQQLVGVDGALGALYVDRREVMIDQSLDPEEFPKLEGRYRFTLAHEIGHWQLHRHIYRQLLKTEGPLLTAWVAGKNRRLERQADIFAACLLMPRSFVIQQWRDQWGGRVVALSQLKADIRAFSWTSVFKDTTQPDEEIAGNQLLEMEVAPLADEFRVSPAAMRIRMEQLGLLVV